MLRTSFLKRDWNKEIVVDAIWSTSDRRSVLSYDLAQILGLGRIKTDEKNGENVLERTKHVLEFSFAENDDWHLLVNPVIAPLGGKADFVIGMDIISAGDLLLKRRKEGYVLEFVYCQSLFINKKEDTVREALSKMSRYKEMEMSSNLGNS